MQQVMVALDGSAHAETALAPAAAIARALGAGLHLVAVHPADEEFWAMAGIDASSELAQRRDWLEGYLADTAHQYATGTAQATCEVRDGELHEELLRAAKSPDVAVVAIATTGRAELHGTVSHSVTDRLLRSRVRPLLVIPPHQKAVGWDGIIVALDGSGAAERALPLARQLASGTGETLHLLHVVDARPGWRLGEGIQNALESTLQDRAAAYLRRVAEPNETTSVLTGHVLDALLDYAEENSCSLLVMATHGRTGPARLDLGSIADAVVRDSDRPVLLVPIRENGNSLAS